MAKEGTVIDTDQKEGIYIIEAKVIKHTPIVEKKDSLPDTVKSIQEAHNNINYMLDYLDRLLTVRGISKPNYNAVVNRLLLSREILDEALDFIDN